MVIDLFSLKYHSLKGYCFAAINKNPQGCANGTQLQGLKQCGVLEALGSVVPSSAVWEKALHPLPNTETYGPLYALSGVKCCGHHIWTWQTKKQTKNDQVRRYLDGRLHMEAIGCGWCPVALSYSERLSVWDTLDHCGSNRKQLCAVSFITRHHHHHYPIKVSFLKQALCWMNPNLQNEWSENVNLSSFFCFTW